MAEKKELVHLTLRKENGQIGYMSKGITVPEFYSLIQPKQQNINITNNILIDFYPIIDKLYSLHTQKQNDDIYVKFHTLYNYWSDGKTYRKENIILSRSEKLAELSNELLNILKLKLNNNLYTWQDASYQKLEKTKNFLEYTDMYIETILCFIHSKASLEIESFQHDKVLTDYIEFLRKIINNLYFKALDNPRHDEVYKYDFFKYLSLKETNELEYFFKLHGDKYSVSEFKIYLFNQLQINSSYGYTNQRHENEAVLSYSYYDEYKIKIAILLRDTLFKIESISKLLEKLKKGNIKWSSENNHIQELESFLDKSINDN